MLICDHCGYATVKKNELKIHMVSKHAIKVEFECKPCNFRTNMKTQFYMHNLQNHPVPRVSYFDIKFHAYNIS